MEYANTWALTAVHYVDRDNGWAATAYDNDLNQIGDSDFDYRKRDAVATARAYLDSNRCNKVVIYTQRGTVQRVITSNRKDN